MISLDKLDAVTTLIVHDNCPDGLASAMILHDALPKAEIVFMRHMSPELAALEPKPGMLFCDFTPHADQAQKFVDAGAIVLDHHKSSEATIKSFGENSVYADEALEPGVSGAVLAFREVWRPMCRLAGRTRPTAYEKLIEDFATLAGIRDTWQRRSPRWLEACAQAEALLFWPREKWLKCDAIDWSDLAEIGPVLVQKQQAKVESIVARAYRYTTPVGTRVVVFQGLTTTSDAAELLGEDADLVIGFSCQFDGENHKLAFSTRSHTTFDCAKFAKVFGGGGHTKAAGFNRTMVPTDPQPYEMIRRTLALFEGPKETFYSEVNDEPYRNLIDG
jgi:oligoribonuclease NrnB/cAMP/cGMP phosphodiesterase (DHH superfamily)